MGTTGRLRLVLERLRVVAASGAAVQGAVLHGGPDVNRQSVSDVRTAIRTAPEVTDAPDRHTILAHFHARQRFEARQFSSFSDEERAQLRRDLVQLSGPTYERWYAAWRAEGDAAHPPEGCGPRLESGGPEVTFMPFQLTERYPFEGAAREAA